MINLRIVARILSSLAFLEAFLLLLTLGVGIGYGETKIYPFILTALVAIVVGGVLLYYAKGAPRKINRRDGYLSVALTWVMFSLIGSIPILFYLENPRISVAVFEATSGFTTTGATALTGIDNLPHSLLFWRSLMHWLGGLGIVFFTVALLPSISGGSVKLFAAESTGLKIGKLHPRVSTTARWICGIYITLTVLCAISYKLAGLSAFDAINHAMSTVSSGGFSTHQDSFAYFDNPTLELAAIFFMFFSGVSFTLIYTSLIQRHWRDFFKNGELRFMLALLSFTVAAMFIEDLWNGNTVYDSLRNSLFTAISVQSTTGFITVDYMTQYTAIVWVFIFIASIIGAMSGSTSGGLKCIRLFTALKIAVSEFRHILHPNAVLPVRINGANASTSVLRTLFAFFVSYIVLVVISTTIFLILGLSPMDAFGVAATMLGNVGPAIGHQIGATGSLNVLPDAGLWLSSVLMLIGRLEIFAILLPFVPSFWKEN